MKKLTSIFLIQLVLLVSSCICSNDGSSITYVTIHSAKGLLFSFDENGVYPYLDVINREKLGLSVSFDSTSERVEFSQNFSSGNQLVACENQNEMKYLNSIDSVNIYTRFNYDEDHPALSNVNDILEPFYIDGDNQETTEISALNFIDLHLKFLQIPIYDTLQFEITGRIVGGESFRILTNKMVLK